MKNIINKYNSKIFNIKNILIVCFSFLLISLIICPIVSYAQDPGPEPKPVTYEVKFDTAGAGKIDSQIVEKGAKIAKPSDPVKQGYSFAGWYKDKKFKNIWDFDNDVVTGNMTLYAKFTQTLTPVSTDFIFVAPTGRIEGQIKYDGLPYPTTISTLRSGMGDIKIKYATSYSASEESWSSDIPIDVGTYYVRANVSAGTSYTAGIVKDELWVFTILKGDKEAPDTPITESATTGMHDGKITGLDSTMEFKVASSSIYEAITATELTGVGADTYYIRYKETENFNPSPDKIVVVDSLPIPVANTDLEYIAPNVGITGVIVYDGSEHKADVQPIVGKTGFGDIIVEYQAINTNESWSSSAPIDAGCYKVRAQVTKGLNYGCASNVTADNWVFTIKKAEQEAPCNLASTNETIYGACDGTISNVTDKMEYKNNIINEWISVDTGQTVIEGLTPGEYSVRYQEKPNYNPSDTTKITIKQGIKSNIPQTNNILKGTSSTNTGDSSPIVMLCVAFVLTLGGFVICRHTYKNNIK